MKWRLGPSWKLPLTIINTPKENHVQLAFLEIAADNLLTPKRKLSATSL